VPYSRPRATCHTSASTNAVTHNAAAEAASDLLGAVLGGVVLILPAVRAALGTPLRAAAAGPQRRARRRAAAPPASRPGVKAGGVDPQIDSARAEIAGLSEALKEMGVRLMLAEGKGRWD
jgi:hypothetical protein